MNRFGMYSMKFLLAAYLYFFSFIPGPIEVNRAGPIQISESPIGKPKSPTTPKSWTPANMLTRVTTGCNPI